MLVKTFKRPHNLNYNLNTTTMATQKQQKNNFIFVQGVDFEKMTTDLI